MPEQQAPYYARRPESNGKTNLYAIAGQSFEIETQYRNCAEILFAAILREPHNFATLAGRMHPVWWEDTQYKKAATAVWSQYYGPSRSYSVPSVCHAAGIGEVSTAGGLTVNGVYAVINAHIETDTALALEMFEPVYRQWIEHRCSLFVGSGIAQGLDAEQIRAHQDAFRNERRAYISSDGGQDADFDTWFEQKIKGLEIDYPCKPSIRVIREKRYKVAYEPGELIIIGARPNMGKTHFILDEILEFSRAGIRGVFISSDMPTIKIKKRIIGKLSGYNPKDDWSLLTPPQLDKIRQAKKEVDALPVVIVDSLRSISDVISLCYSEHYKEPIHYLIIDYLQLLNSGAGKGDTRNNELDEICAKLKHLSKVLKMPVLALSHLSRNIESRPSKIPQLSDLRDSGGIEQHASVVMFLYRDEYYGIEDTLMDDGTPATSKGKGVIIFAKQQEDETGRVVCGFDGVRGWYDLNDDQGQTIERPTYTDYNIPASARPDLDNEKIPF